MQPACEAFLPQAFSNPFGRVPLLVRHGPVRLKDLTDSFQIRPQLLLGSGLVQPIARRLTVLQNLLQRLPGIPVSRTICRRLTPSTNIRLRISVQSFILRYMLHG